MTNLIKKAEFDCARVESARLSIHLHRDCLTSDDFSRSNKKKLKSNYSWGSNNVLGIPNAIPIQNILMFGIGMYAFGMVGSIDVYSYSYGKFTMAALA